MPVNQTPWFLEHRLCLSSAPFDDVEDCLESMSDDIVMMKSVLLFKHSFAYSLWPICWVLAMSIVRLDIGVECYLTVSVNWPDVRLIIDNTLNKILHYPDSNVESKEHTGF